LNRPHHAPSLNYAFIRKPMRRDCRTRFSTRALDGAFPLAVQIGLLSPRADFLHRFFFERVTNASEKELFTHYPLEEVVIVRQIAPESQFVRN
jgi:hypothetical protein